MLRALNVPKTMVILFFSAGLIGCGESPVERLARTDRRVTPRGTVEKEASAAVDYLAKSDKRIREELSPAVAILIQLHAPTEKREACAKLFQRKADLERSDSVQYAIASFLPAGVYWDGQARLMNPSISTRPFEDYAADCLDAASYYASLPATLGTPDVLSASCSAKLASEVGWANYLAQRPDVAQSCLKRAEAMSRASDEDDWSLLDTVHLYVRLFAVELSLGNEEGAEYVVRESDRSCDGESVIYSFLPSFYKKKWKEIERRVSQTDSANKKAPVNWE
jgi:hypothetical protein